MAAIVYSRYQLRPGADRVKLGNLALELCRYQRSRPGCLSSRYYWADTNTVVMLSDFENPSFVFGAAPDPEGVKAGFALSDVADRTAWELWSGAREGTDANRLAGR